MIQLLESYIEFLHESLIEYIVEGLNCTTGYIELLKYNLEQSIKKDETNRT